jgi:hypothetical protein
VKRLIEPVVANLPLPKPVDAFPDYVDLAGIHSLRLIGPKPQIRTTGG